MTGNELILLFKKDNCMNEADWVRFCRRYSGREIFTVVRYIRDAYKDTITIPPLFQEFLKKEIAKVQEV